MKKNLIMAISAIAIMTLSVPIVSYAEPGSTEQTQATQSSRWHSENGVWYLRNEAGTGNVVNSWVQDLDSSWYVLAPTDGHMYAGLIHDKLTNKDYYLQINHDGHYGRMAVTDGVYSVNGQNVHLTFNQSHDGSYGAITSGVQSLVSIGVPMTTVDSLPTDSNGLVHQAKQDVTLPPAITPAPDLPNKTDKKYDTAEEELKDRWGVTDEMLEQGHGGHGNFWD